MVCGIAACSRCEAWRHTAVCEARRAGSAKLRRVAEVQVVTGCGGLPRSAVKGSGPSHDALSRCEQ
jgi:hypothetical protein